MPLATKLYIWSVILEPLLFFAVPVFGLQPGASRFLQALVLILVLLKFINGKFNIRRQFYYWYYLWIYAALIGFLIGIFQGLYFGNIGSAAAVDDSEVSNIRTTLGPITATFLEYIIALYYFFYYVVIAPYFLRNHAAINYFFRVFIFLLILCLIVGYIDYFFTSKGIYIIYKSILDPTSTNVGNRFHGLAGEPRHAFSYLLLAFSLLYVRHYIEGTAKPSKIVVIAILGALLLTKSFTGVISIVLFCILAVGYIIRSLKVASYIRYIPLSIAFIFPVYYLAINDDRISTYMDSMSTLWYQLHDIGELSWPLSLQGRTIYPIYDLIDKTLNFNILPVIFGSGFGSSSIVSNIYSGSNAYLILNPSSQFVRIVFETGILGLILFFKAFWVPVTQMANKYSKANLRKISLITLLVIASGLAQRHVAMYIYLGVVLSMFVVAENNFELAGGSRIYGK
ncbi:MAG: hypothetical protein PHW66_01635 [Gallionella sp.]|nr:hypothetical protein [Gallionella sp.]